MSCHRAGGALLGQRTGGAVRRAPRACAIRKCSSASTISASCASAKWTRPESTCRSSRMARRRRRSSPAPMRWTSRGASMTGSRPSSTGNPTRFAAFAALADQRSQGGGRRARANDQARLQGRDDPRSRQRRLSRRQAVLADLRARAGARRAASTCIHRFRCRR